MGPFGLFLSERLAPNRVQNTHQPQCEGGQSSWFHICSTNGCSALQGEVFPHRSIAPAPARAPLHPTRPGALCSPTPRHNSDVGTGEATTSALGVCPVHAGLATSKALSIRSMRKVLMSWCLKKQQQHRDRDKAQSRASVQVTRTARANIKERDQAACQLAKTQNAMHSTKKGWLAVPDVQKEKLKGRKQHRDSPKFSQQPRGRASTRIQLHPSSQPAALPTRRLHPPLGHQQHGGRRESCHRETQHYQEKL